MEVGKFQGPIIKRLARRRYSASKYYIDAPIFTQKEHKAQEWDSRDRPFFSFLGKEVDAGGLACPGVEQFKLVEAVYPCGCVLLHDGLDARGNT